jgi:hypothetical protein
MDCYFEKFKKGVLIMAKANLKDAYYFSHDSNARNDEKILAMRSVYGVEGYGMYFMIIEILREQTGYAIEVNKYVYGSLAIQLQTSVKKVEKFINDCVNEFSLLTIKDNFLFSESLLRRMEIVDRVSKQRKNASMTRWNDKKDNANAMQMDSKCNANEMQMLSKEEEKKEKEKKEKEIKTQNIIPPKPDWVSDYCKERNNGITASEFIDFYESKGWVVGKSKMKDWQAAIRTWEKNRNIKVIENKPVEKNEPEEVKSRYSYISEEEQKYFFDIGAFCIEPDENDPNIMLECVDYGKLTEEERIYLQKKGVI